MQETTWQPRQSRWNAQELFHGITRADIKLSDTELAGLKEYFWFDLCAEWDSLYLHEQIHAGETSWSAEFLRFEQAWYEDELNHAEGFLAIYSMLYGESQDSIRKRLSERVPDFGDVEKFLSDEFGICVLFAYDELATMRAYRLDLDLYESFGLPQFCEWLRHLMKDETYHHKNGFDLAFLNFPDRVKEADGLIDSFVAHDDENPSYKATFIFDHEWSHVDARFFKDTADILKGEFEKAQRLAG